MKAYKSPEKIYLQEEPTKVRTERLYDNDIEYVQTDAFIEKAWQWIFRLFVVAAPFEFQQGIEKEFRKEMKGE